MPGLRIHHVTHRDGVLEIEHKGDPATGRQAKMYHVTLDGEGDAIVSETVWQRIQEAYRQAGQPAGFILVNEVQNPPAQIVGDVKARERRVFQQMGAAIREILPGANLMGGPTNARPNRS